MNISDILEKYKKLMCPHCINYKKDYKDCNIVIQTNGEADCINYKCNDYCRKKKSRCLDGKKQI